MGKNNAALKKISESPLTNKILVSMLSVLLGTMLNVILGKLDKIEVTQSKHITEFAEYSASNREVVSALAVNQARIVERQDTIYGEQRQRTAMVYGKNHPGMLPYGGNLK